MYLEQLTAQNAGIFPFIASWLALRVDAATVASCYDNGGPCESSQRALFTFHSSWPVTEHKGFWEIR